MGPFLSYHAVAIVAVIPGDCKIDKNPVAIC